MSVIIYFIISILLCYVKSISVNKNEIDLRKFSLTRDPTVTGRKGRKPMELRVPRYDTRRVLRKNVDEPIVGYMDV
uniref:Uncharacterized protein n=1 Tax=Glossina pallidipes TaxID=7398 RepID=A0A1B0A7B2_GLOPL